MRTKKRLKQIFCTALCLCMVLSMSVNASAAEMGQDAGGGTAEHSSHPVCGASHTDIGDHTDANCKNNIAWTAWDGTGDIPYDATNKTAYVYLTKNVERSSSLIIQKDYKLFLCLNGCSITKTNASDAFNGVITVLDGAQFILCDCKDGGKITHATVKWKEV